MSLTLAQVCDLRCITSTSPLCFDLAATESYVTGAEAVAVRVVVGWATDGELLELAERSWAPADLAVLQSLYAQLAEAEDFVLSASITATVVDGGALAIAAVLVLDDGSPTGIPYPFEVTAADAVSVVFP